MSRPTAGLDEHEDYNRIGIEKPIMS